MCKGGGRNPWGILLLTGGMVWGQSSTLDPSIFDGTGTTVEATDTTPDSGAESGKDAESSSPEKTSTSQSGEEADSSPPSVKSVPVPEDREPEVESAEETELLTTEASNEKGREEKESEEAPAEETPTPGSPIPVAEQSRAGEQVETKDRIAPGQAVDLPWDL